MILTLFIELGNSELNIYIIKSLTFIVLIGMKSLFEK